MSESTGDRESSFLDLTQASLKRNWRSEHVRIALKVLLALASLQFLAALAIVASAARNPLLLDTVAALQLDVTWSFALFRLAGMNQHLQVPAGSFDNLTVLVLDLVQNAAIVFLPVFAAICSAPETEGRREPMRIGSGLNSLQIMTARSLGALAPILAVSLLAQLGWGVLWVSPEPFVFLVPTSVSATDLVYSGFWAVGALMIRAGILVCISVLCGRKRTALLLCCGITFVGLPLLDILLSAPLWFGWAPESWGLVSSFGPLIVEGMLFTLLLPRAVSQLDRDEHAGTVTAQ